MLFIKSMVMKKVDNQTRKNCTCCRKCSNNFAAECTCKYFVFRGYGISDGRRSGARPEGPGSGLFCDHYVGLWLLVHIKSVVWAMFSKFPVKLIPLGVPCQSDVHASNSKIKTVKPIVLTSRLKVRRRVNISARFHISSKKPAVFIFL